MSYVSVPGHGSLRCYCEFGNDGIVHFCYTGDLNDLTASGIVTAEMLEPKPRRSQQEVKEAKFHVLNRAWAMRNGVPVPHYRVSLRASRAEALEFPGGLAAMRQAQERAREVEAARAEMDDSLPALYRSLVADRAPREAIEPKRTVPKGGLRLVVDNT